jgi:GNAT superfamily N-acetyltransferase
MYELVRRDFHKIRRVFQDIERGRPFIYCLIEENNEFSSTECRMGVDDIHDPSSVFIHGDVGHYIAGETDNDAFNKAVEEYLLTQVIPARSASGGNLLINAFSDEWKALIDEMVREYGVKDAIRYVFDLDEALYRERHSDWRTRIPEGYHIRRIDRELAERDFPGGAWRTVDGFLQGGFGFCVMKGEERISVCDTVFVGDHRAETSIVTEERYRRQGFGTLACCAYLDHCLACGIRPKWGTFFEPAIQMAKKLGFVEREHFPISHLWFPPPSEKSVQSG